VACIGFNPPLGEKYSHFADILEGAPVQQVPQDCQQYYAQAGQKAAKEIKKITQQVAQVQKESQVANAVMHQLQKQQKLIEKKRHELFLRADQLRVMEPIGNKANQISEWVKTYKASEKGDRLHFCKELKSLVKNASKKWGKTEFKLTLVEEAAAHIHSIEKACYPERVLKHRFISVDVPYFPFVYVGLKRIMLDSQDPERYVFVLESVMLYALHRGQTYQQCTYVSLTEDEVNQFLNRMQQKACVIL
jgi:hypothetical protein